MLVQGERREAGKKASRAVVGTSGDLSQASRTCRRSCFAHPVNATAFSVTDSTFDARTIPESYVFLRDVERVPYGVQYRNDGRSRIIVSDDSPAAILENDGVLVTGSACWMPSIDWKSSNRRPKR